jgi:hypothetical protein
MSKITGFTLLLLLILGSSSGNYAAASATATAPTTQLKQNTRESQPARRSLDEGGTGILQKMIAENGSVTVDLDLNRLNGVNSSSPRVVKLDFAVAANSFFPILVFNDQLRDLEPGSMALIPQASMPSGLQSERVVSFDRLALEKLPSGGAFDLAVRDAKTGFTLFNIEGHQYDYDARAQLLSIKGGRVVISKQLASALGRAADAGLVIGEITAGAAMRPIEIDRLVNGERKSMIMPPLHGAVAGANRPALVPGPDVIVGDIESVDEFGTAATQVGLAVGTDSCNNGDQPVDWFQLPNTDHPVVPQNLYRMSGGPTNDQRFEQIGQSWMKHTFEALEGGVCGTCYTSGCETGTHLCPGCSDPYGSGLNAGQNGLGSRAWINPFTGVFPSGANNHSGHNHDGVSHRIRVEEDDLNTQLNPGATYFAEAAYITPHEYSWCQAHPGECNMYNNVSYRQFSVSGITPPFSFTPAAPTVRMQPAIMAWAATGATVDQIQPDPGNDGIWFMGYKVTNPTQGVWHYEYALYNMNLDRAIQSFSVPVGTGVSISNIDFHAPPQEPGWPNDGTFNNQGYGNTPWTVTQASDSITWNTETIVQNPNANAIRFGTSYNFRFDSNQAPHTTTATVGFFKTGSPIPVVIEAPVQADATPTPTPTASPSATSTSTPLPTPTPTTTPCNTGIIQNEGFETGNFTGWVIDGTSDSPVITNAEVHSGNFSALVGGDGTPTGGCGHGTEPTGDSSFYQQFTVPAGTSILSFWHEDCTSDGIAYDWQDAYITDTSGNILQTIFHICDSGKAFVNETVDMTPYAGQTVRIKFLVHQDGYGDLTGMYVDDVVLYQPCATPSPTPTATPTATATATATPTSTPRPTPTPRTEPTPRLRPTPAPRP